MDCGISGIRCAPLYANGTGVPADIEESREWYRLAAEQGYSAAANLAYSCAAPP